MVFCLMTLCILISIVNILEKPALSFTASQNHHSLSSGVDRVQLYCCFTSGMICLPLACVLCHQGLKTTTGDMK
jgi:hypothetical protein